MVVMIAMATIMVNRFWLSAPIDRPTVAMMTSVEPRAFMPQASAKPSRRVSPPSSPPMKAPPNLPRLAIRISPTVSSAIVGSASMVRSALKPGDAEEHRREEGDDQAAQLLVDVAGEDRRFADQNAGDEGAEHGMHADQIRDQRHRAHDDEDGGDDREFADEVVVDPADDEEHDAPAEVRLTAMKTNVPTTLCASDHGIDRAVQRRG